MPSYAHLIGDRVMRHYVRQSGVRRAHSGLPTVFYRCGKEDAYLKLGEPIPDGAKARPDYEGANARWVADGGHLIVEAEDADFAHEIGRGPCD